MIFTPVSVSGAMLIEVEPQRDERGAFARIWCRREFEAQGLPGEFPQGNISVNTHAGTLRGMHYLTPPRAEAKVVRCSRGAMHDVIVDVRPGSPTYGRWYGADLTAVNARMLFVPAGVAHGFLTLMDDTDVTYQMSDYHAPGNEAGLRWNDPAFNIVWPAEVRVIAPRDAAWPDFHP